MEAIRLRRVVQKDGEILITGLPYKKGQSIDLILFGELSAESGSPRFPAQKLLDSGIIGLWESRKDIGDSSDYARQLRESAQRRQG